MVPTPQTHSKYCHRHHEGVNLLLRNSFFFPVQSSYRSVGSSRKVSKEVQSLKAVVNPAVRPLGDKTPFANRRWRVIQDSTPGPVKANPVVQE